MLSSCVLVNCGSISIDKLNRDLSAGDGVVGESVVVVKKLKIHPHRLILRHIVIVLAVLALPSSS